MRCGSHTVFVVVGIRSRHAGLFTLTATFIKSGCAATLMTMGGPTLRLVATTFVVLGRFYQRCDGSQNVIEARFQLVL